MKLGSTLDLKRGAAGSLLIAILLAPIAGMPVPETRITVSGADPTGHSDSRSAIQQAIDQAAAAGGGVVFLPRGAYLLDSYRPSTHPWKFYNLLLPSGVTLEGDEGTVLLQGNGGRAPLPPRAEHVENNVIAVGTPQYQQITFQNPALNGGFRPANATPAGSTQITLSNPADAAALSAGDLIMVYAATSGDVIESEPAEVASIDRPAGIVTLSRPLARAFPAAWVARVTSLATRHVALRNLTIQGAVPLAATEVFDLSLIDCRLIYDTSAGASNMVSAFEVNTIQGFTMEGGSVEPSGSQYSFAELPQRNSQNVRFEHVTFKVSRVVFGEYAAHWKLLHNEFWIYPDSGAGIATGGLDVEFAHNVIHGANLTAGGGSGALVTDGVGTATYIAFIGQERFEDNTIECRADGNNCMRLTTRDPVVNGNHITATGSAVGLKIEGEARNFSVTNNRISVGPSPALVLNVADFRTGIVKANSLSGSGPFAILVSNPPKQSSGDELRAENAFAGFATPVFLRR